MKGKREHSHDNLRCASVIMGHVGGYTEVVALRVAAIDFLNPAPLMWDLTHPPLDRELAARYAVHLTSPANCARQLLAGEADLGLIPVAALTPELAIVPGCAIASLKRVRSIVLIVKGHGNLSNVRTVAADNASRSSAAYVEVLFRHFWHAAPEFVRATADAEAMLAAADAALLIGDPALLALERRTEIETAVGPCRWLDIAEEWNKATGLPWIAAVWAVRPQALDGAQARQQLITDLNLSRDHGLAHVEDLVREWTPRIALPQGTIRTYLTENIFYYLDEKTTEAIRRFRALAAEHDVLPPLGELNLLEP